jgi:hypothetical protein
MTDRGMYAKISAYRVEMALLTIFKTTNPTKLLVSKKNSANLREKSSREMTSSRN